MRNIFVSPKAPFDDMREREKSLFPSILVEQASSTFLGIANTIVVGLVSTAALAGVGQINMLNTVVFMTFNSLSQGGAVIVAQSVGAGDRKRTERSFEQALVSGTFISLIVMLLLILFKTPLLTGLYGQVEPDVMAASVEYFSTTVFATPLWFIYYQISGGMRSTGDTKTPMRATIVMNVVNLAVSLFFVVFMNGSAFHVGLSLVLSLLAGNAVCIRQLMSPSYRLSLPDIFHFKPDFGLIRLCFSVGIPVALENLMFHGGRLIVQVFVSAMGTAAISGYNVANSLCQICQLPLMAANVLIVTLVGQRAGAGGKDAVYKTLSYLQSKTFTWSLYVGLVCMTLTYPMAYIFSRDREVVFIAWGLMVIYGIFMPFFSPSFNTPQGFRGARDTKYCLVIGTASMWVVRVLGSYLLGVALPFGVYGIYLAMCLDWVVRAAFYMARFKGRKWLKLVSD